MKELNRDIAFAHRLRRMVFLAVTMVLPIVAAALWVPVAHAAGIHVDSARIGCLRLQHTPNLTPLVKRECEGKYTCNYKAPTPKQYRAAGVHAAGQSFCRQHMEIKYHCGSGSVKTVLVQGNDAWNEPPAALMCTAPHNVPTIAPTKNGRLRGFVDLHTHPMANLAFGGKLYYGGVDVGSLLPADPHCHHNVRAASEAQALGDDRSTHGGWNALNNKCGDDLRQLVIKNMVKGLQKGMHVPPMPANAYGYPSFHDWPKWYDLTHQKMWVDWIRRAYTGGLRVMVALAVNNKMLGDMTRGPGDLPDDDKRSADLQITELKSFVARHPDFMQVAYSADDLHRIVAANKLAVVLGTEIDHIGDLHGTPSWTQYKSAIDHLYGEGVRYIFPVHLVDNPLGGAAAYTDLFNVANVYESGHPYALVCAPRSDGITYRYSNEELNNKTSLAQFAKLGHVAVSRIPLPDCPIGAGEKNSRPLTNLGQHAIKYMMSRGMLIDIDHMDQNTANAALHLAQKYHYPVNSGHNGLRGKNLTGAGDYNSSERQLLPCQYRAIGELHGMAGVGSAKLNAQQWLTMYRDVVHAMGDGGIVAGFGTDWVLEFGMPPRPGSHLAYSHDFPPPRSGSHTWNYNRDGVAQYGMLWDFLQDIRTLPGGADMVNNHFLYGADYFYHTWKIAESRAKAINPDTPATDLPTTCPSSTAALIKVAKNAARPHVPFVILPSHTKPQAPKKTHPATMNRVKATPAPVAMPKAPPVTGAREDCISFDPRRTAVKNIRGHWKIVQGKTWLFDFGSHEKQADVAHGVITHYGMNKVCYVGRPHPSLTYLLVGNQAPRGSYPGEDCLPFDPRRLSVGHLKGRWKIVQGRTWLLDFGTNESEARQALAQIKKYGFTRQCFVGRSHAGLGYFRR